MKDLKFPKDMKMDVLLTLKHHKEEKFERSEQEEIPNLKSKKENQLKQGNSFALLSKRHAVTEISMCEDIRIREKNKASVKKKIRYNDVESLSAFYLGWIVTLLFSGYFVSYFYLIFIKLL